MKKLSIVVPYRDRAAHLQKFIPHMTSFLGKLDYEIHIVEQTDEKPFNRGKLLNVGYDLSKHCDYFCFHDVDMLPEKADYSYCDSPTHLASEAEQFGYQLPYDRYFGGVTIFDKESFVKINGYSNEYWGWGAEDDDVFGRCYVMKVPTMRKKGRFSSLDHERKIVQEDYNKNLSYLREFSTRVTDEGMIEGLTTLEYEIIKQQKLKDYTITTVSI